MFCPLCGIEALRLIEASYQESPHGMKNGGDYYCNNCSNRISIIYDPLRIGNEQEKIRK